VFLLLLACGGPAATDPGDTTPTDDTTADTVDTREPVVRDTFGTFDTDVTRDTWTPIDAPIGATSLDGDWAGTFDLVEEVALVGDRPACAGTVSFTIDGDAARHVISTWECPLWDPNIDLLPGALDAPYGAVSGVGFGTLDPADLAPFRMNIALIASAMTPLDLHRVTVKQEGETLVIAYDDITGIGPVRQGHKLDAVLSRVVVP
jgi:hypothetical protein